MRIFMIGATGFIGLLLAARFRKGGHDIMGAARGGDLTRDEVADSTRHFATLIMMAPGA